MGSKMFCQMGLLKSLGIIPNMVCCNNNPVFLLLLLSENDLQNAPAGKFDRLVSRTYYSPRSVIYTTPHIFYKLLLVVRLS